MTHWASDYGLTEADILRQNNVLTRTRYTGGTRVGATNPVLLVGAGVVGGLALSAVPILWIPLGAGIGYLVGETVTSALIGGGVGWLASRGR